MNAEETASPLHLRRHAVHVPDADDRSFALLANRPLRVILGFGPFRRGIQLNIPDILRRKPRNIAVGWLQGSAPGLRSQIATQRRDQSILKDRNGGSLVVFGYHLDEVVALI